MNIKRCQQDGCERAVRKQWCWEHSPADVARRTPHPRIKKPKREEPSLSDIKDLDKQITKELTSYHRMPPIVMKKKDDVDRMLDDLEKERFKLGNPFGKQW